ncbi:hypothetical protein [Streptomyces sp. NPDC001401]|uniref:hypothetical protein n=1 Tax=Streptomyces sp. NPDC001401 TaxID=3364570 RepID=UPI0036B1EECF
MSPVPADLVTFYDSIGDVTWADVGNGYFVDPAGVLLRLKEYGAVDVGADQKSSGLVIGSNTSRDTCRSGHRASLRRPL